MNRDWYSLKVREFVLSAGMKSSVAHLWRSAIGKKSAVRVHAAPTPFGDDVMVGGEAAGRFRDLGDADDDDVVDQALEQGPHRVEHAVLPIPLILLNGSERLLTCGHFFGSPQAHHVIEGSS